MAVTKIWPVRGSAGSPIDYVANEEKTENPRWNKTDLENLTDVMHYAVDEDKTEKQFFVTGINCSAEIARDQFVTVKKQFGKEGGIVAYHAYQSFAENEVSPDQAHEIGLEFAGKVWGDDYQVVVATHLNTDHIHNHFVVNSVSFRHGKRLREKQWYDLNKISDEICKEHGLSVVERAGGRRLPKGLYEIERQGGSTRLNVAKKAVDEAIAVSVDLREFKLAMKSLGYTCDLSESKKYWTVKMDQWQRPIRLIRMGAGYSNERLLQRIREEKEPGAFLIFQRATYAKRQYRLPVRRDRIRKVGGLKGLYLHYCYLLGYLPAYKKDPVRVPKHIRDDLIKLDMISEEARLIVRENISSVEELDEFKTVKMQDMEAKISERNELMKLKKRSSSPEEKDPVQTRAVILKEEIGQLKKEVRMADSIKKRSKEMEDKIRQIEREVSKDERRR